MVSVDNHSSSTHAIYPSITSGPFLQDVPCDLLTGEERVLVGEFESPHLSCTVEMASTGGSRLCKSCDCHAEVI